MNVRRVDAIGAIGRRALAVSAVAVAATLLTGRADLILSTAAGAGLAVFNFRTLAALMGAVLDPEGDPKGGVAMALGVAAGQTALFAAAVGILLMAGLAHGVGLALGLSVIPAACAVWFFTGRRENDKENEATVSPTATKVNA
ncbi:MAG: hypothetical protein HQK87_06085 [Nitrospinae bacterium]|nr:hypothetical protein [Nitrospinota bacterium]